MESVTVDDGEDWLLMVQYLPDHNSFQAEGGQGRKQGNKRKRKVEASELNGTKVPGDTHSHEQAHAHAHDAVNHEPAHVPHNPA
jgi:hypothetical protein